MEAALQPLVFETPYRHTGRLNFLASSSTEISRRPKLRVFVIGLRRSRPKTEGASEEDGPTASGKQ